MDSNDTPTPAPNFYEQEAAGPTYTELAMASGMTPGKIAAAVDYVREHAPADDPEEYKRNALIVAEALELVTCMAADLALAGGGGAIVAMMSGADLISTEEPQDHGVIVVDLGPLPG